MQWLPIAAASLVLMTGCATKEQRAECLREVGSIWNPLYNQCLDQLDGTAANVRAIDQSLGAVVAPAAAAAAAAQPRPQPIGITSCQWFGNSFQCLNY